MKTLRPMSLLKILMLGFMLTIGQFVYSIAQDKPLQEALVRSTSNSLATAMEKTFDGVLKKVGHEGQVNTAATLGVGQIQAKNSDTAQQAQSIIQDALRKYQETQEKQ